jgi:hypothetical protein
MRLSLVGLQLDKPPAAAHNSYHTGAIMSYILSPGSTDKSSALVSECGKYRYLLWRKWAGMSPSMVFIMLNPTIQP